MMFTPRFASARQTVPSDPGRLSIRMVNSLVMGTLGTLLDNHSCGVWCIPIRLNGSEARRGWRQNLTSSTGSMQEVSLTALTACTLNISVRGRQLQRNEPCLDQSRQLAILLLNTRVANEHTEGSEGLGV